MKALNVLVLCLSLPVVAMAQKVAGPDGRLVVDVTENGGRPCYSVSYDGVTFVKESPLGLKMNIGDMSGGMVLAGASDVTPVKDSYSLPNLKKSHVDYNANRRVYSFTKDGKNVYDIVFEVGNNDVAFKYVLAPRGETKVAVIDSEATSFILPEATTTFLCPQMQPMGGFARTSPSYETSYTADAAMGTNGHGDGFVFPALFKNGEDGWMLISETGVDGSYCGSHLDNVGANKYQIAFPNPKELNGLSSSSVGIRLPGETPWRTITVGRTLAPIAETTVATDLVRPKYAPSKDYQPGKGTWSWIMRQRDSGDYAENVEYIDLAAAMGYQSVLVDACWDTNIGYDKIVELKDYAKSKGVDLFLWYNSNGYWNDAPQTPRDKMDTEIARRAEMEWMQKNGIRGIKVDFFGGDKQQMMQLYEDILRDANDYGLLVIFHGCTLPRGWDRMYPNFAAAEAVRASENLYFGQHENDIEAFSATFHPVCRNTVAAMDFGGSALNKRWHASNKDKGNIRRTSDVFQCATAVIFQSPVQHFAIAPNNLTDAPAWAVDFLKEVPTTWDEIKFIDGYPGKYLIMARRHGDTWYVTGINAEKHPLKTKVALPMFKTGKKVTVYTDDAELNGSVKDVKIGKKQIMEVDIPTNGAFIIKG
ncbi:MAG: glycoside hydrolase family 97 protein [Muribaculaceae bacterium]|nr:glycoside hydrolase family 97 protein [Muribaculaceae bacterium]